MDITYPLSQASASSITDVHSTGEPNANTSPRSLGKTIVSVTNKNPDYLTALPNEILVKMIAPNLDRNSMLALRATNKRLRDTFTDVLRTPLALDAKFFKQRGFTIENFNSMPKKWKNNPEFKKLNARVDDPLFPLFFASCLSKLLSKVPVKFKQVLEGSPDYHAGVSARRQEQEEQTRVELLLRAVDSKNIPALKDCGAIVEKRAINQGENVVVLTQDKKVRIVGRDSDGALKVKSMLPVNLKEHVKKTSDFGEHIEWTTSSNWAKLEAARGPHRSCERIHKRITVSRYDDDQFTILDGDVIHVCTYPKRAKKPNIKSVQLEHIARYAELGKNDFLTAQYVQNPWYPHLHTVHHPSGSPSLVEITDFVNGDSVYGQYFFSRDKIYKLDTDKTGEKKVVRAIPLPMMPTREYYREYYPSFVPLDDGEHILSYEDGNIRMHNVEALKSDSSPLSAMCSILGPRGYGDVDCIHPAIFHAYDLEDNHFYFKIVPDNSIHRRLKKWLRRN